MLVSFVYNLQSLSLLQIHSNITHDLTDNIRKSDIKRTVYKIYHDRLISLNNLTQDPLNLALQPVTENLLYIRKIICIY